MAAWPTGASARTTLFEVVDPVVDDDDHSAPLVDGTPRTRGSMRGGGVQRPGERLEGGLDDVMRIVAPDQVEVDREPGVQDQRAEELGGEEHVVVPEHLPLRDVDW